VLMLLKHRNFALLWTGGLISMVGNWMLYAALPYYVYQQTQSTLATAAMVAAGLAPHLILGSVAGVFVDRWDRKRVMVISSLLQAGIVLLLLFVRTPEWVWLVYVVKFLQACIGTFFGPAEGALLPRLVGEELLLPAQAMNALNNRLARLIGPPLGGVLLGGVGLAGVVIVDSVTFLLAGLMIARITLPSERRMAAPATTVAMGATWRRFWLEWRGGLQIVRQERVIATLFTVLMLMNFGGIMIDPLYPGFVEGVIGAGPQAFGWLLTGLILGRLGVALSPVHLLGWGSIVGAIVCFVQFNLPFLPVALVAAFLLGFPSVAVATAANTLVLISTPEAFRGRILGALSTTIAFVGVVGTLGLAGGFGELLGIVPMLNVAAGLNLLAGLVVLVLLPRAVRSRSSEVADPPTANGLKVVEGKSNV
jgi:hypothetical protein